MALTKKEIRKAESTYAKIVKLVGKKKAKKLLGEELERRARGGRQHRIRVGKGRYRV